MHADRGGDAEKFLFARWRRDLDDQQFIAEYCGSRRWQ